MHPNETLARRWFEEVWNQGDETSLETLLHPAARAHDFPAPGHIADRATFIQSVRDFRETFSELKFIVEDVVVNDHTMAIRWYLTARHTGYGLGILPTQQPITLSGITMAKVLDGQIVEGWTAQDLTRLIMQLQDATRP